jgi:hypothetical protein
MSLNLTLKAKFIPTGHKHTKKQKLERLDTFNLWQTPTKITLAAMDSNSPYAVYSEWVKNSTGFC